MHGTELWFVTQSFAFAVFATLICQINSVFPCKDTKAAKSCAFCVILLVPNSWMVCFGFVAQSWCCGTELEFVAQSWGFAPKSWHRARFFCFFSPDFNAKYKFPIIYIIYTTGKKEKKYEKKQKSEKQRQVRLQKTSQKVRKKEIKGQEEAAKTGCRLPRNLLHKQYGTPYETR